jgi:hypothetical protein
MQYFFKSYLAIATTSYCSVSLMRMHRSPVPQKIKRNINSYSALVYTTNRQSIFFLTEVCCQLLDDGSFASHKMYIHNQCQQKDFALRDRFFASLIIFVNMRNCKGLAMINKAATPP